MPTSPAIECIQYSYLKLKLHNAACIRRRRHIVQDCREFGCSMRHSGGAWQSHISTNQLHFNVECLRLISHYLQCSLLTISYPRSRDTPSLPRPFRNAPSSFFSTAMRQRTLLPLEQFHRFLRQGAGPLINTVKLPSPGGRPEPISITGAELISSYNWMGRDVHRPGQTPTIMVPGMNRFVFHISR